MISFDFSKAFDRVPHNLLIYKLKTFNFDKPCINWIEEWLHRRSSVVSVNGLLSEEFHVKSGVPQGSVLGPLLFILYVNDMSEDIKNSDCRLYADDTILSSASDPNLIQDDINKLYIWAGKWGMKFNNLKCCHLQFGSEIPTHTFFSGL